MALGGRSDFMLLEDANDLVAILEDTGRTVPRGEWAEDVIAARNDAAARALAGSLL